MHLRFCNTLSFYLAVGLTATGLAQEFIYEKLDRGLVAIPIEKGGNFVSWRCLANDPKSAGFDVFRHEDGMAVKLNSAPLVDRTNFIDVDTSRRDVQYSVVLLGHDGTTSQEGMAKVSVWPLEYLEIPLVPVETIEDERAYRPGDGSVADLDGDGELEFVVQQSSSPKDNSFAGITGRPILDAYKMDGTHLWRIDLGINIRDGEHYTQFMVFDLDGDGKAEVACKTADGTRDGVGKVIGDDQVDYRNHEEGSRLLGRVLEGPEYLTVFRGTDGAALYTTDYIPTREPLNGWGGIGGNGGNDSYGNRCDRFLACVAFLDGERPSLVMCRGVYGRIVMVAWDWNGKELRSRWQFDSGISMPPFSDASPYSGMGGHSLAVADVDADGRDEIVYQAMVVDDDGTGLHSSGLRHGDSMHVTDIDPDNAGMEIFTVQENEDDTVRFQTPGAALRDAKTGKILWSHSPGVDIQRGLAADIDPRFPGLELWSQPGGLRSAAGEQLGEGPESYGFALWWDGDDLRELLGRGGISKWDWEKQREVLLQPIDRGRRARNPTLSGDILGDWREELVVPSPDGRALRIYSTTVNTDRRMTTLLQDRQYRLALTWQNVVYNKPPHPSFGTLPTRN